MSGSKLLRARRSSEPKAGTPRWWQWPVRAVHDPVVPILFLAGLFDGLSGNPVHAAVLWAVALHLAPDAVRSPARVPVAARGRGPLAADRSDPLEASPGGHARVFAAVGALLFAVAAGGFARYSWPATVSVVIAGALGLRIAWRSSTEPDNESAGDAASSPLTRRGATVWLAVFLALALWELAALLLQPSLTADSYAHPTISVLMDPVVASHVGRTATLLVWLGLGWFLVKR